MVGANTAPALLGLCARKGIRHAARRLGKGICLALVVCRQFLRHEIVFAEQGHALGGKASGVVNQHPA